MMFKDKLLPTLVSVVTTMYEGVVNAAPITWFSPCSYDPPLIMLAVKYESDTFKNIVKEREFVLQTFPMYDAQEVHNLAKKLPQNESEIDESDFTLTKSEKVQVPRITECKEWYECEAVQTGRTDSKTHFIIIGKVLSNGKNAKSSTLLHKGGLAYSGLLDEEFLLVKPY